MLGLTTPINPSCHACMMESRESSSGIMPLQLPLCVPNALLPFPPGVAQLPPTAAVVFLAPLLVRRVNCSNKSVYQGHVSIFCLSRSLEHLVESGPFLILSAFLMDSTTDQDYLGGDD